MTITLLMCQAYTVGLQASFETKSSFSIQAYEKLGNVVGLRVSCQDLNKRQAETFLMDDHVRKAVNHLNSTYTLRDKKSCPEDDNSHVCGLQETLGRY